MIPNLLGGPTLLEMRQVINLQKGGTFFFVLALMLYYNNFSWTACTYLASAYDTAITINALYPIYNL